MRDERNRVRRNRRRRANAVLLRELREFFGMPVPHQYRLPIVRWQDIANCPVIGHLAGVCSYRSRPRSPNQLTSWTSWHLLTNSRILILHRSTTCSRRHWGSVRPAPLPQPQPTAATATSDATAGLGAGDWLGYARGTTGWVWCAATLGCPTAVWAPSASAARGLCINSVHASDVGRARRRAAAPVVSNIIILVYFYWIWLYIFLPSWEFI